MSQAQYLEKWFTFPRKQRNGNKIMAMMEDWIKNLVGVSHSFVKLTYIFVNLHLGDTCLICETVFWLYNNLKILENNLQ